MPRRLGDAQLSPDDTITLGAVVSAGEQELSELDLARSEFTVTPMPFIGPASLLAVAARTVLPDAEAAENYLARLRLSGAWIDQLTERLRAGAAKGRLPVARLSRGGDRLDQHHRGSQRSPRHCARPSHRRGGAARRRGPPSAMRWPRKSSAPPSSGGRTRHGTSCPRSRSTGEVGLVHLPDGAADYERAILVHTTLPLTADDLHRIGLEEVDRLEERCRQPRRGARPRHARCRAPCHARIVGCCRSGGSHGRRRDGRAPSRACCGRVLPGTPAPGVRGHPDASRRGRERHGSPLHTAPPGRHSGGHLLVQHGTADSGHRLGHRGSGLP